MMANESRHCYNCRNRQITKTMTQLIYSIFLVLLLGLVNLPCGFTHIASVLEKDGGVPGLPMKIFPRGPTVAPVPSPETLDQFEQLISKEESDDKFFNPGNVIRNLLSFSSSSPNRLHDLKRLSQFHGNGDYKLLERPGTYYRPQLSTSWDYEDQNSKALYDEEAPTFVPFIGARALTNMPEFFAHLKENLEALPRITESEELDMNVNDGDNDSRDAVNDDEIEMGERALKKDQSKSAARRMKAELHVDENMGRTTGNNNYRLQENNWSSKQNWKPHAAGQIHYYSPKSNFIDSQQNILRRAHNYNPAWLYTNLGLGKRRR